MKNADQELTETEKQSLLSSLQNLLNHCATCGAMAGTGKARFGLTRRKKDNKWYCEEDFRAAVKKDKKEN